MLDEQALIRAIVEYPDEDTPRLMYADWLDENGQPDRAEFIRLQVAIEGMMIGDICSGGVMNGMSYSDMEARMWELRDAYTGKKPLQKNGERWLGGFSGYVSERQGANYRRGFMGSISMTAAQFLKDFPRISETNPINQLHLTEVNADQAKKIAQCPALARIRELDLENTKDGVVYPEVLTELLASPYIGKLRTLIINGCAGITDEHVQELAKCKNLHLEELSISGNELNQSPVLALQDAPWIKGLKKFYLDNFSHLDLELENADPAFLERLTELWLIQGEMTDESMAAIGIHSKNLLKLSLSGTLLEDTGMHALLHPEDVLEGAGPVAIRNLRDLGLGRTGITSRACAELAASHVADSLTDVMINHNPAIGNEGIKAIAESPRMSNLRKLQAEVCNIGDEGAVALARSPHMQRLEDLALYKNDLGRESVEALAKEGALPELRVLQINQNPRTTPYVGMFVNKGETKLGNLYVPEPNDLVIDQLRQKYGANVSFSKNV